MAGEEFLLSLQPWLPALTHCMDGKEGKSSQAGHAGILKQAGKGNLHMYSLHKDWDEVVAGTRLEVLRLSRDRATPHPMEVLLWEAAVERLAAPASF